PLLRSPLDDGERHQLVGRVCRCDLRSLAYEDNFGAMRGNGVVRRATGCIGCGGVRLHVVLIYCTGAIFWGARSRARRGACFGALLFTEHEVLLPGLRSRVASRAADIAWSLALVRGGRRRVVRRLCRIQCALSSAAQRHLGAANSHVRGAVLVSVIG